MPGQPDNEPVAAAPAADSPSTWARLLFWGLLLAGFILRVLWLGRASYVIDEINVVRDAVTAKDIAAIWATEMERFTWYHRLPVLMTIIRLSTAVFGSGQPLPAEWISRLPFALIGTASLPLFYLLAKSLRDRTTGLWAMGLATFSVYHCFYSREAYEYSLLIFFALGSLWGGVKVLGPWVENSRFCWKPAGVYMAFSVGLLYAHLAGLLFLAPWTGAMALAAAWRKESRKALRGLPLLQWVVTLGIPYFFFLPFLVRLMGFGNTDIGNWNRFSWSIVPQILGRMGWGEGAVPLTAFTVFFGLGAWVLARSFRDARRLEGAALLVQAVVHFAVQSYALRVSRFEIRYYSAAFPLVILLASVGVVEAIRFAAARIRFARAAAGHAALSVALLGWLGYGCWMVSRLECRGGYNYKAIANWIMQNVPPKGIAFFFNIYELRGVPQAYPVTDRSISYVGAWSSHDDYTRVNPPQRVRSLFSRFPQAYFVEIIPSDLLWADAPDDEKIPRDPVLRRRVWLVDPAYGRLARLKLLPLGEAQWSSPLYDRILISYNELNDMPYLAASQGRPFFHYFGNDWGYAKDPQMNDWLTTTGSATMYLGNIGGQPARARVRMAVAAVPSGGRVTIFGPDGKPVLAETPVPAAFHEITIPEVLLQPGISIFSVQVLPPPGALDAQLLVYAAEAGPAAPLPAAPPSPAPQAQSH